MSAKQSSVNMERFAAIMSAAAAARVLTMETTAIVSTIAIMYTCKLYFRVINSHESYVRVCKVMYVICQFI